MASTRLSNTMGTPTLGTKFTFSCWVKRSSLGAESTMINMWKDSSNAIHLRFDLQDNLSFYVYNSASFPLELETNAVFKDVSSWYHIVAKVDTTQSTASDRCKLYVNGSEQTSLSASTYPSQDATFNANASGSINYVGGRGDSTGYFDGLMSQVIFVDGTAYDASTFGSTDSTSGEWKPNADPTVSYGNNGFKLTFEDTSNLGDDTSGNTNDFTMSGTGTSTLDCPSNVYATWNPLNRTTSVGIQANGIQNGNTYLATATTNGTYSFGSTLALKGTGKFYMEFKVGQQGTYMGVGIAETDAITTMLNAGAVGKFSDNAKGWSYKHTGKKENGGSEANYGATYTTYDYIGLAYNNGTIWFSKNGTWQNSATISEINAGTTTNAAFTGIDTSKQYFIMFDGYNDSMIEMNAGNGYFRTTEISSPNNPTSGDTGAKFKYTVPTGYQPLSTKGLNE